MNIVKLLSAFFVGLFCCFAGSVAYGQGEASTTIESGQMASTPLLDAQKYAADKNYDSAILLYQGLYEKAPDDIYPAYFTTLLEAKKYKDAEKLALSRMGNYKVSVPEIDLGRVYKLEGKDGKAKDQFEEALKKINGDDILTQREAKSFTDAGELEYALKVFDKASQLLGNTGLYAQQVAAIYIKLGQLEKAMDAMMANNARAFVKVEDLKALFLQWMGDDPAKLQAGQKNLLKRLNEEPDNVFFAELLTWIYTQKNDWDGALMQMEAVDERNKEAGLRLINFARNAAAAHQYEAAYKAYDDVIAKGPEQTFYTTARSEKINATFNQIEEEPIVKREDINSLMLQYRTLLNEFPQYYAQNVAADYAMAAAHYADSVQLGIDILQKGINYPDTRREQVGLFKLQLGDYYLLQGKIWDASLTYSQVDKEFKQDAMGEDARFRNAKLAYYRGDFEYAQHLLGVLKASTSELIANDALFLSVQITENVQDSNFYPLTRFAYAGLLLSENKDSLAEVLIDSIATAFPKHPLIDDILMEHAKIALKHHDFERALKYLNDIVQKFGQDVLGDDALYMTAEIYRNDLHKNDEAKKYYEQLIIDFPGSTFVQSARNKLKEMAGGTMP